MVTSIGMRASIFRTWQGAEVIVPNANLISSEVINWTFSDESHRMEISVGVAYGPDPQRVVDLHLRTVDETCIATAAYASRAVQPAGSGPGVERSPADRKKPKEDT